jgi:hypothetical protein
MAKIYFGKDADLKYLKNRRSIIGYVYWVAEGPESS